MSDRTFKDGWYRFWGVFDRPWPAFLGFMAASCVLDALAELLKAVVKWATT